MNNLAITGIIFSFIIIIIRGPLIFFPSQTLNFYKKIISTNIRLRVLGLILIMIGYIFILVAYDSAILLATILKVFGWLMVIIPPVFLLLLPGYYRKFANYLLSKTTYTTARIMGIIAVSLAAYIIYLSIKTL